MNLPSSAQTGASQPRWVVLADYPGEEEGTVRVWQGDLVEVIDISRNEWCLIRPVLRSEEAERRGRKWGSGRRRDGSPLGFLNPTVEEDLVSLHHQAH